MRFKYPDSRYFVKKLDHYVFRQKAKEIRERKQVFYPITNLTEQKTKEI